MISDRRTFLKLGLSALVVQSCWRGESPSVKSPKEVVIFGLGTEPDKTGKRIFGVGFLSEEGLRHQVLENEIHSISYSKKWDLTVYLPKLGHVGYYQKGQGPLLPFSPGKGKLFYGHGVFDEKRDLFYSTQSLVATNFERDQRYVPGEIFVHSLENFAQIDQFSSFGYAPHDVMIFNQDLVVCNGGDGSNVAFIDLDTRKLIKSHQAKEGRHVSFGHLTQIDDRHLAVAAASRQNEKPASVYSVSKEEGLKHFPVPAQLHPAMDGQILSVISFEGHVFGTCPGTGHIFCWKNDGTFVNVRQFPQASSLVYSENFKGVLVGAGDNILPLHVLRLDDNGLNAYPIPWKETPTGSHSLIKKMV